MRATHSARTEGPPFRLFLHHATVARTSAERRSMRCSPSAVIPFAHFFSSSMDPSDKSPERPRSPTIRSRSMGIAVSGAWSRPLCDLVDAFGMPTEGVSRLHGPEPRIHRPQFRRIRLLQPKFQIRNRGAARASTDQRVECVCRSSTTSRNGTTSSAAGPS